MPYKTICKKCRKHKSVYKSGLCKKCDAENIMESQLQMKQKRGPAWKNWKKGMRRYLEEDVEDDEQYLRKVRKLARRGKSARKRPRRKLIQKRSLSRRQTTRPKVKKSLRKK